MNKYSFILLLCLGIFICIPYSSAQMSIPTGDQEMDDEAWSFYDDQVGMNASVLRGRRYVPYPYLIEGHPFTGKEEFVRGDLKLNAVSYRSLYLAYDAERNALVIAHPELRFPVVPLMEEVKAFSLGNRSFCRPRDISFPDSLEGYMEWVISGKYDLFIHRRKMIVKVAGQEDLRRYYKVIDRYFLREGTEFTELHSIKDLYQLLPEQKASLKSIGKKGSWRYPEQAEAMLTEAIEYLNTDQP